MAQANYEKKKRFYKKRWFKVLTVLIIIALLGGGAFLWKTGNLLNKISSRAGIFNSLVHAIPGVKDVLRGENDGRINILLMGMRGADVPGGGLLADTIMVASVKPQENKVALISIPRDLYVDNPVWGNKTKINAVYAAGEENGKKQGIEEMEKVVSDISGIPIHYGVSINFKGFSDLVDALGGITVHLDEPFNEALQFHEPHVCDSYVYTVPTKPAQYEYKYHVRTDGTKKVVKAYPLCYNSNEECGGNFSLPAGDNQLDGSKALCYARARYTSSDFERAKRQQITIQRIKEKALSVGTLSDFGKVNAIMNALGDNVRTDMEAWEMEHLFGLYQKMNSPQMFQRVLENSEEGLLYNPPETPEAGYILFPIGDNYDRIRAMFRDIFTMPAQTDIKPK